MTIQANQPDYSKRRCVPCEGDVAPLAAEQVRRTLAHLPGWETDGKRIWRTYGFKDYYQTMALVNAIAYIAHQENHHPDMEVGYNQLKVIYITHAIGGISENDLICATRVNRLVVEA